MFCCDLRYRKGPDSFTRYWAIAFGTGTNHIFTSLNGFTPFDCSARNGKLAVGSSRRLSVVYCWCNLKQCQDFALNIVLPLGFENWRLVLFWLRSRLSVYSWEPNHFLVSFISYFHGTVYFSLWLYQLSVF